MGKEQYYKIYKNGELYAIVTAHEAADHFHISLKSARGMLSSGRTFLKMYTAERAFDDTQICKLHIPPELLEEWDRVRMQINPKAKR